MKIIKTYIEFSKVNEEEGWKEKALAGAIAAGSLTTPAKAITNVDYDKPATEISYQSYQAPSSNDSRTAIWPSRRSKIKYKETSSREESEMLQRQNWTLDSVSVDTIWTALDFVKPSIDTIVAELKFDNKQYFESGKYSLTQEIIDSLDFTIEDIINDNGVIMSIMVESSTDKQGLSLRLQQELKSKGYEPNNIGLSKARCESITSYLESVGVDSSIIKTNQIVEAGQGTIDQSARYVTVKIVYVKQESVETPSVISNLTPEVTEKYYLSKEYKVQKKKKVRRTHRRPKVRKFKKPRNITDCFKF